jgi:hypothetical protein
MHQRHLFLFFFCGPIFMLSCIKGKLPAVVTIPPPRIDSVFQQHFRLQQGIVAGEGTRSFVLDDGRTIWLFGASHVNDFQSGSGTIPCSTNVRNAAMISSSDLTMTLLNTSLQDFIPSNETGTWFSPLHAYQYADTLFVFAKKMGGLPNNRTYVSKFLMPAIQYIRTDSMLYNNTRYGYSVFIDKAKGFGYTYGLYNPNGLSENKMYLARFPMNSLHSKWQFYSLDEDTWKDAASSGSSLAEIPGENFCVRKVRDRYVLLTQEKGKYCNQGKEIYAQTATNLWGPFLNFKLIYTIDDQVGGVTPVTYDACLHPQQINPENEILITYTRNGYAPCITTCNAGQDNPDFFRVRTLRVPLKSIDAGFK